MLTTGVLDVKCSVIEAEVLIDGILKGKSPLVIPDITAGEHLIRANKNLYGISKTVNIKAGIKHNLFLELIVEFGYLKIDSKPQAANVYLDDKMIGKTPIEIPKLSIGGHSIKLTKYLPEKILSYSGFIAVNTGENKIMIDNFEKKSLPANMVYIPAGEFNMGDDNADKNQQPVHSVYLDAFYIDKYEVTNAEYDKFVKAAKHNKPKFSENLNFSQPDYPVVGISWSDAADYCAWAGKSLPTEAQWEKAARGDTASLYPWGNKFVYGLSNIAVAADPYNYTAAVGSYPKGASAYGVFDMAGNAAEWCADWYDKNYYQTSPQINPTGAETGEYKVVRGGSWDSAAYDVRTTFRWRYYPDLGRSYIGFRCVYRP